MHIVCSQAQPKHRSTHTRDDYAPIGLPFLLYSRTLLSNFRIELSAEEIYLNSRTFLWPHELEQVLELSAARLSVVRENLEVALK